jgi:hypothetical protein
MGVDHVHNVNIIEQLNPNFVCSAKDVPSQCVLTDDYQIDVLGPIDHRIGLETLSVEPPHVQYKNRPQLIRRETRLGLFWNSVSNKLDCLIQHVNGTRRNSIKPSRLASD